VKFGTGALQRAKLHLHWCNMSPKPGESDRIHR